MTKAFVLLAVGALSTGAQPLSSSKLSVHLINNYTIGSSNIIAGHPRTLKVLGLDSGFPDGMAQAMRDYKAAVPGGKVVVRIYSPRTFSLADEPSATAADFWTNILQKGLGYLAPADRGLIDYLEGPNEGQTPTLGYPSSDPIGASRWFNQFWTNLTPRIVAAGYKPCVGSIAVGNPGGSAAQMQSYLDAFVPALRQAKAAGGAWSYHAYTINYTTDVSDEIWYSLRYRQFYSYFASAYPDLVSLPLILTEGGVDQSGDPATSGWQARGSAADYQRWLNWFEQQLQQDSYVLGCTLFEIGNPESWGWPSFDLEPIAGWMKNYLNGPTDRPVAPSGLAASPGNGNVTLTWTNVPTTPTTWTIKRGTNSGGPYFTLAANIATGVRGLAYVDSPVANGRTYYYVVCAVNALGESDPCSEAAATPLAPAFSAFNCGGPAAGAFQADAYYDVGTAYTVGNAIDTSGIVNPAPIAVYQSQRYGDLTYTFPYLAPKTAYKIRLHFAEIFWTSPGQRVFNVLLNGQPVLKNCDIVQAAGAAFKANAQEFNGVSDANGQLTVQLATVTDNASINGIEIIANPGASPPATPTNLTATIGNALVTIAWSVPAGATNFTVKRATASAGPYSVLASNLTQGFYRDPSFTPNVTYYYEVSAANGFGVSADSAPVSARPTNGLPDLVITSVSWSPANLFSGTPALFSARVLNRGSAATPGGIVLGVGFNVDGAGTVSWSGSYVSALPVNGQVTLTADGGPTSKFWPATTGPHTLVATVDDVDRMAESIEDNNSFSSPLTVAVAGYALNSGGGAVGGFAADANFAGSANTFSVANAIDISAASNPAPSAVYQSERWGEFTYVLPNLVPGSNYTARLHFAETSPSVNAPGDRQFNVAVNGLQVLTDFDIFATAGARFRALTREFKLRADSSGTLWLRFTRGSANQPKCSGVEVFGSTPATVGPRISGLFFDSGQARLTWQSVPGAIYQVQYKSDLNEPVWTPLAHPTGATGTALSVTDTVGGAGTRFYRVVLFD